MRKVLLCAICLTSACGGPLTAASPAKNEVPPYLEGPAPSVHQPYEPGAPDALACEQNLDQEIESQELQTAIGISLSFLLAGPGQVDVVGDGAAGGVLTWDWRTAYPDQTVVKLAAEPLGGKWFASRFPGAQFTLLMRYRGHLMEAVNSQTSEGLFLHGMASSLEAPPEGKTLLVYDQPVQALKYPLKPGMSWTAVGRDPAATVLGLNQRRTDTYEVKVDAAGEMLLPDLAFSQVHRVRTKLSMHIDSPEATVTQRQVSYFAECLGEVARATSALDEQAEDFTSASEIRRLGL
ncbi:MAG: hypothetical protein HY901_18010 [Deltaproteobacteria bacterium]|nr:hypothetical protein [Deltaproteobacteria bacterium]